MSKKSAAFLSVAPSPYQRDLFQALADHLDLTVFYLETTPSDSPWPVPSLQPYEHVLPGFWVGISPFRFHFNYSLPDFKKYDVVVMNTLVSGTAQRLMRKKLTRLPWIFWGEILRPQSSGMRRCAQSFLSSPLSRATALAGIGSRAAADYQKRFPNHPVFNIPYHCDLGLFQEIPLRETHSNPPVFLFCGQMIERKGVDILLGAFDRLIRSGRTAQLALVGREADLPAMLLNISPETRHHIQYHGFQSPDMLPSFFAKADVFVLPSRHDGWGVVVNQALGAGLPLICSDAVMASHDLVEENINGVRVPPGNQEVLFEKMSYLIDHPEIRALWGKNSREKSVQWTHEKGAEKWCQAIEAVL